jgi:hypothetical protein
MPGEKLAYTKQEPAFLRRLRSQHGGPRNNVQFARPNKARLKTGDDDGEDDPVIVDEAGEDVSRDEWERRVNAGDDEGSGDVEGEGLGELGGRSAVEAETKTQKVAEIGGVKKRKVAKVVGEGEEDGELSGSKGREEDRLEGDGGQDATGKKDGSKSTKSKKKAKKIKLSFDEPD